MDNWLFKWRGYAVLPVIIIIFILAKPTAGSFWAGLGIAVLGELIRIWGVGYAGKTTRNNQLTAPLLVTAGPYAYLRNPLYLGNCITALGFTVIAMGGLSPVMRGIILLLYLLTYLTLYWRVILAEETFLAQLYGEQYQTYLQNVPRIIPRLKPWEQQQGNFHLKAVWQAETHTIMIFIVVTVLFYLKYLGIVNLG